MSSSYTVTESSTFTISHARHMAAKVATDLKRMQRFYGAPSDTEITAYETEVIELLRAGYLGTVSYGFRKNGQFIEPTLRYTAMDLAGGADDDDPGKITASADVTDAAFHSYCTYSPTWDQLTAAERDKFKRQLPFYRNGAAEPTVNGYLVGDRTYSSGGRALNRSSVRSFS